MLYGQIKYVHLQCEQNPPFKNVIKKVYYENHKNRYFINYPVFYLL